MPDIKDTDGQPEGTDQDKTTEDHEGGQEPDWKAEAEKWKTLSRQNEARAKENAEKAKRLDETEEANKSELQKEREARETAERKLQDFESQREAAKARASVAETFKVPADALRGNTPEELEEHAKILQPLFAKPGAPSTDGQGKVGDKIEGDEKLSPNELLRIARGA